MPSARRLDHITSGLIVIDALDISWWWAATVLHGTSSSSLSSRHYTRRTLLQQTCPALPCCSANSVHLLLYANLPRRRARRLTLPRLTLTCVAVACNRHALVARCDAYYTHCWLLSYFTSSTQLHVHRGWFACVRYYMNVVSCCYETIASVARNAIVLTRVMYSVHIGSWTEGRKWKKFIKLFFIVWLE